METRKTFTPEALNLLLTRTFGSLDGRMAYDPNREGWFGGIIIDEYYFKEVIINEKSDDGLLRGIFIFWEAELIELHFIDRSSKVQKNTIEYLPLTTIYQLTFKTMTEKEK